jgi:hypothetical protein
MCRAGFVAIVSLVAVAPANADEIDSRPQPGPLALRGEFGQQSGAAIGAELRLGPVGLRATAGANLILVLVKDPDEDDALGSFEAFGGWQVNGELFWFPFRMTSGNQIGFSAAVRHSTLLGTGGGASVELRRQLRPRLGLSVAGGLTIFPDGEEGVIEEGELDPDVQLNDPFGVEAQLGATVGLTFDLL